MPPPRQPDHEDHGRHGEARNESRFPEDQRLRRAGYRIVRRPKNGPAIWCSPWGDEVEHDDALADVEAEERERERRRKEGK
jgi:hypothetical protein